MPQLGAGCGEDIASAVGDGVVAFPQRPIRTRPEGSAGASTFSRTAASGSTGQFVMATPTSAPPGPAARYSRTLIRAAPYSRTGGISFAAITPDGKHVCFSIYPQRENGPGPGQIRIADLGSNRSRLVASNAQYQGLISADPRIRHLLLYIHDELVSLDLRNGKMTPLPAALRKYIGEIFW